MDDWRVAEVIRLLNEGSNLQPTQLAATFNLSESRLRHIFRDKTGMSLKKYRQECKLQYARRLLQDSTGSIKEICVLSGIHDPANFAHLFKRRFGLTPSVCRLKSKTAVLTKK